MNDIVSREIHLRRRPVGMPQESDFEVAETKAPPVKDGQVLVRNLWMSVDPYMRFHMMEQKHYPVWPLNGPGGALAIGKVVESRSPEWKVGDYVGSGLGWREYFVADGHATPEPSHRWRPPLMKIDPKLGPLRSYLGNLGMPGFSGYVGLMRIGALKPGETVLVSGAAGAVGVVVCQIAKAMDCKVIAFAGTDEKCDWLTRVARVDHAINYRTAGPLKKALRAVAGDGVDVFFDNVGGEALEAALGNMRHFGRLVICGTISQYNSTSKPVGPANLNLVVPNALRLEGFEIADHWDLEPKFYEDMAKWIAAGKMDLHDTVVEGIENAPKALIGLFKGENLGKMLVRIGPED